ncbi:hypothetical protein [Novosphingobium sp.]|uniref:hypothetical protein n=1 Tax=Novosphingobium sp. TaxID=1874826 RepID=UPI0035B1B0C8
MRGTVQACIRRLALGAALLTTALFPLIAAAPARANPGDLQMWGSSGRWRIVYAPGFCSAGIPDKDNNAGLMLSVLDGTGRFISVSKSVATLPQQVTIVLVLRDGTVQRIVTDWNADFVNGAHDVMGNHVLKEPETAALRTTTTLRVEGLDGYEPVTLAPGEVAAVLDNLDRCLRMQN